VAIKGGLIVCAVVVAAGMLAEGRAIQTPAQQPEFKTLKADFVPGEKTIFFDDFTDMAPGDAPPHFKVRGAAPELREAGTVRQLTATQKGILTPNLTALPANFTFEAETSFNTPTGRADATYSFFSKNQETLQWVIYVSAQQTDLVVSLRSPKYEELGRTRILPAALNVKQPMKLALWMQNGRVRIFINGEKHLDFNQVALPPIDRVEMAAGFLGTGPSLGYRSVRFAESTPDFSAVINASGRYVSHGILFDTNSDRLKPESAAAIQTVAKGLDTNPALKLLIEGHTDSVGNAAANLDLSKRRAEAVKAVLVSQFNVDASRLTTNGLGATKPIDSNDTPQGRAQNRRVEFVKQ
jgi:outer membrane protein OmpA-like peptidoglycan-associated protein